MQWNSIGKMCGDGKEKEEQRFIRKSEAKVEETACIRNQVSNVLIQSFFGINLCHAKWEDGKAEHAATKNTSVKRIPLVSRCFLVRRLMQTHVYTHETF